MDPESVGNATSNVPRKVRFAPKAPRRLQKPVVPKVEKTETINADEAHAQELLQRFNEASLKVKPKAEKKATQVAFGYGGTSNSIKSYGALKGGIGINSYEGPASDAGGAYSSGLRAEKEYKEPWDYYSNYPATLPLRRPYSGNPGMRFWRIGDGSEIMEWDGLLSSPLWDWREHLNEEEFGEAAESMTYYEESTKPAIELGLMEENLEPSMLFLQLPASMPMVKQSPNAGEVKDTVGTPKPPKVADSKEKPCSLDELPAGFMGKMLIYKSGAVKLKLGDTIYDVSAGLDCVFAQDVVAINTEEKHCCIIGELGKRAVITPDVDSVLNSMSDLL